jgi:enoyl-CoA hydratase/carnithine racemase
MARAPFRKDTPYYTELQDYQETWAELAHLRREDGILEVRFHWDDGPWRWNEAVHGALVPLLSDISHDPRNECLIVTGTGDAFLDRFDPDSIPGQRFPLPGYEVTYDWWWTVQTRLPGALIDVPVPVVAAINGPVSIHPEVVLLSDIVIASSTTTFADRHLADVGLVPSDGTNVLFRELLGHQRAKLALYSGRPMGAEEALALGVVSEVVEPERVLERAWDVARTTIMPIPRIHRRITREILMQPFRELYAKEIRASLAHEGWAATVTPRAVPDGQGPAGG